MRVAALLLEGCPNAYWDVFRSSGRIPDASQHKTKLFGTYPDGVDLASNVHGSVIGHVVYGKSWANQRSLEKLYALVLDACRGN
jgi:hypothetical protein